MIIFCIQSVCVGSCIFKHQHACTTCQLTIIVFGIWVAWLNYILIQTVNKKIQLKWQVSYSLLFMLSEVWDSVGVSVVGTVTPNKGICMHSEWAWSTVYWHNQAPINACTGDPQCYICTLTVDHAASLLRATKLTWAWIVLGTVLLVQSSLHFLSILSCITFYLKARTQ